jgi:hypothetical protein
MKRYLVFAYAIYYPRGGWNDFVSQHDSYIEACAEGLAAVAPHTDKDVAEIFDTEDMRVVRKISHKEAR